MKRHEDPFFEMFREGLQNYEAQPSAEVYAGVQSQLRKGAFLRFSWYQFNVYYLLAIMGVALMAALVGAPSDKVGNSMASHYEPVNVTAQRSIWENATAAQSNEEAMELIAEETLSPSSKATTVNATKHFAKQNVKQSPSPKATAKEESTAKIDTPIAEKELLASQNAEKNCVTPVEPKEAPEIQLPENWAQSMQSPELHTLMEQLESDSKVVYLTLPVKIEVEEKE